MEAYYDASVTASILLQEVMKDMGIKDSPGSCCKKGLDKKIFRKCAKVIDKEYTDPKYRELLKLYISSYFVDEALDNEGVVFEELDENELYLEDDDFFYDAGSFYNENMNNAL